VEHGGVPWRGAEERYRQPIAINTPAADAERHGSSKFLERRVTVDHSCHADDHHVQDGV
jgi:hypothetical protein